MPSAVVYLSMTWAETNIAKRKWNGQSVFKVFSLSGFNGKLTCGNKIQTQLNSTCHAISVRKLLQIIVNFESWTFLTALVVGSFLTSGKNYNCCDKIKGQTLSKQIFVPSVATAIIISKPTNSVSAWSVHKTGQHSCRRISLPISTIS